MHHAAAAILARLSWRTLRPAADRGDPNAIEAIWQGWLRHPDDERWELLTRWRGARPVTEAVFAAAVDPARPAAARAALGAFCARHGLAPGEPPGRARFSLLTGQPEQHRAADPDSSALAAAYHAGDEQVRAALRQAMADSGGLDLVRVVAARGGDAARGADAGAATEAERAYLTAELARRQDWPRLWRLALDLPLTEAITAARLLPSGWRAPDDSGQRLLARLTAASPAQVSVMTAPVVTRLETGRTVSRNCQFAPGGGEVAVGLLRRKPAGEDRITVYALPSGRELETFRHPAARYPYFSTGSLLHLGAATVFAEAAAREHRLVRNSRGHGFDELSRFGFDERVPALAPVADGFVVVVHSHLFRGTAEPGSRLRDVTRSVGGLPRVGLLASEPRTGRVAVAVKRVMSGPDSLVVLDPDFEVIAQADGRDDGARFAHIGFCGPSLLVTCDEGTGRFRSWRVEPVMAAQASTVLPGSFPTGFQSLASAGLIVIDSEANVGADGMPRPNTSREVTLETRFFREYLDARTLRPAACPAALQWARQADRGAERIEQLFLSQHGGHAALSRWRDDDARADQVEVRDLVREQIRELVSRPLARSRPADLAAVTDLAERAHSDDALAALGLLRACLEHRFGADVAIGQARGRPVAAADDIAL